MMGFIKYQKVEGTTVVSPQGHKAVEQELHKTGKTTMKDVSESERKIITDKLDRPK